MLGWDRLAPSAWNTSAQYTIREIDSLNWGSEIIRDGQLFGPAHDNVRRRFRMKISHEALSNISDLTNLSQPNASTNPPKLPAQSEPQRIPNPASSQDPAILDHVLATAPDLSTASDNAKN